MVFLPLQRNSRGTVNPGDCFKFKVEDRFQCRSSGKVSYKYRQEYLLPLPIPVSAAHNKDEVAAFERKKAEAEANKMCL
jgi:ubiquitin carboxyl-terminal hydrolase 5/13